MLWCIDKVQLRYLNSVPCSFHSAVSWRSVGDWLVLSTLKVQSWLTLSAWTLQIPFTRPSAWSFNSSLMADPLFSYCFKIYMIISSYSLVVDKFWKSDGGISSTWGPLCSKLWFVSSWQNQPSHQWKVAASRYISILWKAQSSLSLYTKPIR